MAIALVALHVAIYYIKPIVSVFTNFKDCLVGELKFRQEIFVTNFYSCISKEQLKREFADLKKKEQLLKYAKPNGVSEATKNIFKLLITNKKLAIAEALEKHVENENILKT
jgi:hypothetical protein